MNRAPRRSWLPAVSALAAWALLGCQPATNLRDNNNGDGGGSAGAGGGAAGAGGIAGGGGAAGAGGTAGGGGTAGAGGIAGGGGTAGAGGIGGNGGDSIGGDAQTSAGDANAGDADLNLCPRLPAPDDYPRAVVISHPYAADNSQATTWEVWTLATDGTLSSAGVTFSMGRSTGGVIAFTPDGEIGLVAQQSGGLGVFRLGASGPPEVIYADYGGGLAPFYARDVIVGPAGRRAYVIDGDTRGQNGGGIYALRIECDGTLTELGLVAPANTPAALRFVPGATDRAVVAADDILASSAINDVHLLAWSSSPALLASADALGVTDPEVSGFAVTPDGHWVLMGDISVFNVAPNGVAVVEIAGDALYPAPVIDYVAASGNEDPVGIVVSPYNNAALVLDGYANGVWILDYDPTNSVTPFVNSGEATYAFQEAAPQLPCCAVVVERGALAGRILIAELTGIRQMQFEPTGGVTDIGLIAGTVPVARIVGAIGVQP